MADFLLEIGVEELPHSLIDTGIKETVSVFETTFKKEKIGYRDIKFYSTPRRLAILVSDINEKIKKQSIYKKGPLLSQVFKNEKWTPQGLGFLKSTVGESFDLRYQLQILDRKKPLKEGLYKEIIGNKEFLIYYFEKKADSIASLLPHLIEEALPKITFSKMMKWGSGDTLFLRPIRWLLCLLDRKTVSFRFAGLDSNNVTYSHGQLSKLKSALCIPHANEYKKLLKKNFVICDSAERKKIIDDQIENLEKEKKINVLQKEKVSHITNHLVEYPTLMEGTFNASFLSLPSEVLISEMVEYQKYFPVSDLKGNLLPRFIMISNITKKEKVIKGNERVLSARFKDAEFLYKEDIKVGFNTWEEKLKKMTDHHLLGSYFDKTERLKKLGLILNSFFEETIEESLLTKAITYMKCDLVSEMVKEFPTLQGVMGRYYANEYKWNSKIGKAFSEQYLPKMAHSPLPETTLGICLALIDKFDLILSCYAIGLIPTGSEDPYALRRAALGISRILIEHKISLDLFTLIKKMSFIYQPYFKKTSLFENQQAFQKIVLNFFKSRLVTIFKNYEFKVDEIKASFKTENNNFYDLYLIVFSLHQLRQKKTEIFNQLIQVLKRLTHMIQNQEAKGSINEKLIKKKEEKELYNYYQFSKKEIKKAFEERNYEKIYQIIANFKEPLSHFFNEIFVLVDDEKIRINRLLLLIHIENFIKRIIDFNEIKV